MLVRTQYFKNEYPSTYFSITFSIMVLHIESSNWAFKKHINLGGNYFFSLSLNYFMRLYLLVIRNLVCKKRYLCKFLKNNFNQSQFVRVSSSIQTELETIFNQSKMKSDSTKHFNPFWCVHQHQRSLYDYFYWISLST